MKYNIWMEGAKTMEGGFAASYIGEFEANSIEEAKDMAGMLIENREKEAGGFYKYDKEHQSFWGCGLFDNEIDARKFAG